MRIILGHVKKGILRYTVNEPSNDLLKRTVYRLNAFFNPVAFKAIYDSRFTNVYSTLQTWSWKSELSFKAIHLGPPLTALTFYLLYPTFFFCWYLSISLGTYSKSIIPAMSAKLRPQ